MPDGTNLTAVVAVAAGGATIIGIGITQAINVFVLGGKFAKKADQADVDQLRLETTNAITAISTDMRHLVADQAQIREDVRALRNGHSRRGD